jgi:putative endonuclease
MDGRARRSRLNDCPVCNQHGAGGQRVGTNDSFYAGYALFTNEQMAEMLTGHADTPVVPARMPGPSAMDGKPAFPIDARVSKPDLSTIERKPAVYILASRRNGTLYVGVTSNLVKRVWEHKKDLVGGFTKKYGVHLLVYYERFDTMPEAIRREKQMKRWQRAWKLRVIEEMNPTWRDLWEDFDAAD